MVKLNCKSFGFDCNFEVENESTSEAIETFGMHTSIKHGVKYTEESLMQLIVGLEVFCPYCNSKFLTKEQLSKHIDRIHHGSGMLEGDTRNI